MHCPWCGSGFVRRHVSIYDDKTGDLHLCTSCGHNFYHTGGDYHREDLPDVSYGGFKVKLMYFKASGKYYADADVEINVRFGHMIPDKVREMLREGVWPGLSEGEHEFYVLVHPEGGVPHMMNEFVSSVP
jgi:hypothetical protein